MLHRGLRNGKTGKRTCLDGVISVAIADVEKDWVDQGSLTEDERPQETSLGVDGLVRMC